MQTHILSYRTIIEPVTNPKTGKTVYTAYSPKLGVSDWGKTIELALLHIQEAIECHLESLSKHHQPIPAPDQDEFLITTTRVNLNLGFKPTLAY